MHDGGELFRDLGVDLRNRFVDREIEVLRVGNRPLKRLLGQRPQQLFGSFWLGLLGSADRLLKQIGATLGYRFRLRRGLEPSGLCHGYSSFSPTGAAPSPLVAGEAMPSDAENFSSS